MSNYTNIHGVEVSKWPKNGEQEDWDDRDARLEECYFDPNRGMLEITLVTDEGVLSIDIPVTATEDWNDFAESLPEWRIP